MVSFTTNSKTLEDPTTRNMHTFTIVYDLPTLTSVLRSVNLIIGTEALSSTLTPSGVPTEGKKKNALVGVHRNRAVLPA